MEHNIFDSIPEINSVEDVKQLLFSYQTKISNDKNYLEIY
jgi:hypothetical protein